MSFFSLSHGRSILLACLALAGASPLLHADWLVIPGNASWKWNGANSVGAFTYNTPADWAGGVINNDFYENVSNPVLSNSFTNGFDQIVYLSSGGTTYTPLSSLTFTVSSAYGVNQWGLLGSSTTANTVLTLNGNIYALNQFGDDIPASTGNNGDVVSIGSTFVTDNDLSINLNGATRTFYSQLITSAAGAGNPGDTDGLIINNAITGTAGINVAGYGTLILAAVNTFTGNVNVESGSLELAYAGSLTSSTVTLSGGTVLAMGDNFKNNEEASGAAFNPLGLVMAWNGTTGNGAGPTASELSTVNANVNGTGNGNGNRLAVGGTLNIQGADIVDTATGSDKASIASSGDIVTLSSLGGIAVGDLIGVSGTSVGGTVESISGNTITLNASPTIAANAVITYAEVQTLGNVNMQSGTNIFTPATGGAAFDSAVINIASLNRSVGAIADFEVNPLQQSGTSTGAFGTNFGLPYGENDVTFTTAPTLTGGILPWATLSSNGGFSETAGFATLAQGTEVGGTTVWYVVPLPSGDYTIYNNATQMTPGNTSSSINAEFNATSTQTLTGTAEVNSLFIEGGTTTFTAASAETLQIDSGGIMIGGGLVTNANVTVSFNGAEAVIQAGNSATTFNGNIIDASALDIGGLQGGEMYSLNAAVGMMTFANATPGVTLNGTDSWTGGTYIDSGRLIVGSLGAIPTTSDVYVGSVGALSQPFVSVSILDLNKNSISIGSLSGGGLVDFVSVTSTAWVTGNFGVTLTLGDANSGGTYDNGTFSGSLLNTLSPYLPYLGNSVTANIIKVGTGTETFSGLNLYEGTTTIDGGTLAISGTGTLGVESDVTIGSGGTLDISAASIAVTGASGATVTLGSLSSATQGAGTVTLGANYLATSGDDTSTTYTGEINGSGGGLVKNGYGTLTLDLTAGGNTNWTTTVDSGILLLDHASTSSTFADLGTGLILGGGTLQMQVAGTTSATENAGGVQVNAGASAVQTADITGTGGTATATLNLGSITRNVGGTVDFLSYQGGSITTTTANTNGILGGWATYDGTDWAAVSGGSIVAYTGYSDEASAANWIAANNLSDLSAAYNFTATSATSVNSLKINNNSGAGNITLTGFGLTIGSGGILETANVGANNFTITGGTLATGNGQDLIFIQNNPSGTLSVSSAIGGTEGVTKSGVGTVVLSGSETYTGPTTVNAGELELTGSATLGAGTSNLTVASGAVANLSGTGATAQAASSIAGNGLIVLNSGGFTVGSANDTGETVDTFSGQLSGAGGLTKTGLGTLVLAGAQSTNGLGAASEAAQNTYTGATNISQGTVQITGLGTLGNKSAVTITGTTGDASQALTGATTTAASTTVTVASNAGILVGDTLAGAGIPFGDTVTNAVTSGGTTTLTLSTAATVTAAGTASLTDNHSQTFASATLDLSQADNQISLGSLAGTGNLVLDPFGLVIGSNNTSTSFSGTIMGTGGIVKTGAGTFTYSGATEPTSNATDLPSGWTIDQGTIDFDYSTNPGVKIHAGSTTSSLTLAGGTLEMNGNSTTAVTETASATTLGAGPSTIVLEGNGAAVTLKLSTTTRGVGSTVDFSTVENSGSTGTLAITTNDANVNGILGGWATFNNESGWAADTGAAGTTIIAYTGYSDAGTAGNWVAANNLSDTSGVYAKTLTTATTVNSLRINNGTGAGSINTGASALTLTSGGLLETSSVGANNFTISGTGALSSSGTDLIIIQNNTSGTMDITAPITGNIALTKSGAGTLILDQTNTYTNGTYVDAGTLQLGNTDTTATLGATTSGLYVAAGATADLSRVSSVTLGGAAALAGAGNVITPNSGNMNVNLTGLSTFSGVISGTGNLAKSGSGTLLLSGANTFTGTTTISGGGVLLNGGSLSSNVSSNGNTFFGGIGTVSGTVAIGALQNPLLYVGIPGSANAGVQAVGTLTTGALTLSANSTIDFVVGSAAQAGATYSTMVVNGALSLGSSTLQLTTLDGFQAGTYQLFSDTSETGTFGALYLNSSTSALNTSLYQIDYNDNGFVDLTIDSQALGATMAVPEPGTWALLMIGGLLLLTLRIRSAKKPALL